MSLDNYDSECLSFGRAVWTMDTHYPQALPETGVTLHFTAENNSARFAIPNLSRDDLTRLRDLIERRLKASEKAAA